MPCYVLPIAHTSGCSMKGLFFGGVVAPCIEDYPCVSIPPISFLPSLFVVGLLGVCIIVCTLSLSLSLSLASSLVVLWVISICVRLQLQVLELEQQTKTAGGPSLNHVKKIQS